MTCPRCSLESVADYYGPCETCRTELRATMGSYAHEIVPTEYQPKINVTPNAVAMRDD